MCLFQKKYQEFIALAQRLQIRYVWIDSLCIIQEGDDGEDWRAEALTMDQVYQNSFCNVSADWGSGKRGLYFERDLRLMDKPHIDWKVRHKFPEVLREGDVIFKAALSKLQMTPSRQTALEPATPGTELYDAWGDVLEKNSSCNLTFASDRAVAFAGIAKFFRALVDDNYVVGLWLRNLASEMMWYRDRLLTKAVIEEPRDRLSLFQHDQAHQYRAPSFSWASTAVPVAPNHAKGNSGFLAAVKCVKYRDTQNALVEEWTDDLNTREATLDFQLDNADIAAWAAKDNLYYIPWQDHWKSYLPADSTREHPDDDFLTCLLLELVDAQMSRFRRIGRLYINDKSQRRLYIAKQENEANLPCAHYDATTRRHTIYII
ncbi:hypothetical protein TGAM01_v206874 [Trichoderma gamsii]|uniref:Heterokaryon incompatibility domain-containing protein n=1 Tax=Trichoderma gamsii TaxID=398673 RepID=A0A2P4ZIR9_9HYPO|nr:hypothetical protein TGAM01_v206874 [Trichoderma gamsii]PON24186.1 hypothetical protein TGAM01_v206874 [Trichoderma gamsii]